MPCKTTEPPYQLTHGTDQVTPFGGLYRTATSHLEPYDAGLQGRRGITSGYQTVSLGNDL